MFPDVPSHVAVAELINETGLGDISTLAKKTNVAILYEAAKSGEASARPHLRPVPFRDAHCMRMVRGAFSAVATSEEGHAEIPSNCIFFLADGKVHGNEHKLTKGLVDDASKSIPKIKKTLYMFTSESSEAEWRGKMQGFRNAI